MLTSFRAMKIGSLAGWARELLAVSVWLVFITQSALADHCVLVEGCSTSTCPHCAVAAEEMRAIEQSGSHEFCYVSLVLDRNSFTRNRASDFGIEFVPHYFFDGGAENWLGSGSLPDAYVERLDACSGRSVAAVEVTTQVIWRGDALLEVDVSVINGGDEEYRGHLRSYVTEIESRWLTRAGRPFHHAMIGDLALDEEISVPAGETRQLSTQWDGSLFGVGDIEPDNIRVAAAVFRGTTGFVDDSASATVSEPRVPDYLRGDANSDGRADLSDAVFTLGYLFLGSREPSCLKSADVDDNGRVELTDAVRLLNHLFSGAPPPDRPFDECGPDPTEDDLTCLRFPPCEGD